MLVILLQLQWYHQVFIDRTDLTSRSNTANEAAFQTACSYVLHAKHLTRHSGAASVVGKSSAMAPPELTRALIDAWVSSRGKHTYAAYDLKF